MTCYLDNINIEDYGVKLLSGAKSIIELPKRKAIETNKWWEYSDIDADLDLPAFEQRSIALVFASKNPDNTDAFFDVLTSEVMHALHVIENSFDITLQVRLDKQSNLRICRNLEVFTLNFNVSPETFTEQMLPGNMPPTNYLINGTDLKNFNVQVINGTRVSFRQKRAVEGNLSVNLKNIDGVIYDDFEVKESSRQITLNLYLKSVNLRVSRNTLMFNLSNVIELTTPDDETFNCYYLSSQSKQVLIGNNTSHWLFSMTFQVFDNDISDEFLLTEDGEYILTEDNKNIRL